jgi:hypothetical protein
MPSIGQRSEVRIRRIPAADGGLVFLVRRRGIFCLLRLFCERIMCARLARYLA